VSFNSTSLVSIVPSCNKVSSSSRDFLTAVIKQLTFIGAIVLFQRIEPGFYSVLFYHIVLKSDFVSEQVVVEDIYLIFGIDLAGDKVMNDQIISEEPS
jgi:hypothetical protein